MNDSIVQLKSLDDLKKVLSLQRIITTKAKNELVAVASDKSLEAGADLMEETHKFLVEEKKLLDKYAKYPTLTEFQLMPNSYDGYKWGATFGVTLLVGELIFEQLKIVFVQVGHGSATGISNGGKDVDQPHVYAVCGLVFL